MKSNSTTVTLARVTREIEQKYDGRIPRDELLTLLSEYGVNQQATMYVEKLLEWGYLHWNHITAFYCVTGVGAQTATITITVPRLNAKEVRRHLVEKLAGYDGMLEVSEVMI